MNSQTGKDFPFEYLYFWGNSPFSARGGEMCAWIVRLFSGRNEPTFPFLPGGFIAIAVGDGEKLMELPQRRSQLKPQPSQQVTPSTSPNMKDLGEKLLWVGFAEKFPSYRVVFPGRSQRTFVVISEEK